jgi:hypothetical protein
MMNYCAVIGDIVGSKKINERQKIQDHFKEVLNRANYKYDKYIASNFTVTLGDEFQVLLITPSISMEIIQYIKEKMYPVELVFGIGIGEMLTSFSKDSSVGSDGPAYWFARKAVEKAKDKKPSIRIFSDSLEDDLLNSLILFCEVSIHSQTTRQQEIVKLYKELGSQYTVAERLGINQSAVSVSLQKAFFKEIESSFESIRYFLKTKWEYNNNF